VQEGLEQVHNFADNFGVDIDTEFLSGGEENQLPVLELGALVRHTRLGED
jgi:hypothetical protein